MSDAPLQPFPHIGIVQFLPGGLSGGVIVMWVLYAIFAFWAVYTLVAIYHWLKYSHASLVAVPAIALHLALSFALMSYALTGNAFFLTSYLP
jgi:hypothetical protein